MNTDFDLQKLSVTFTGVFGTFTVRNYGDKAASINIITPQKQANIVKTGAAGDTSTMKQFDISTKNLVVSVLKDSPDDIRFKNIQALEESGSSVVINISVIDENTKEKYNSVSGSLNEIPDLSRGTDMDQNIAYSFHMPEAIHTPPVEA